MRAAVLHGKRDMRLEEMAGPKPKADEIAVRVRAVGICGSDLHYFHHGANGTISLKEPLILGHEIAGVVHEVGSDVTRVRLGQKVIINPSRSCGTCEACREGKALHCKNGTFFGSAMRFPHIQGGLREVLVCDQVQAFPVDDSVDLADAAFAEPLAVCLHAVSRAGSLFGKRVLVTGAGPIGILTIMLARHAGASSVVATDLSDEALAFAAKVGADHTVNVRAGREGIDALTSAEGFFDTAFECSGHPSGVAASIDALRTCGVLVQVGMLGRDVTAPLGAIVVKEIDYRGTFRFDKEFAQAVDLIASGTLDFQAMLSHRIPFTSIVEAFDLAADRSMAMKVQVVFD